MFQPYIVSANTTSTFPSSLSRRHDVFCGSVQKATGLSESVYPLRRSGRISSKPICCAKPRACLGFRARTIQATMESQFKSSVMSRRIYSRVGAALRVEEVRPLRWVRRAERLRGARDAWVIVIRWRLVQRRDLNRLIHCNFCVLATSISHTNTVECWYKSGIRVQVKRLKNKKNICARHPLLCFTLAPSPPPPPTPAESQLCENLASTRPGDRPRSMQGVCVRETRGRHGQESA